MSNNDINQYQCTRHLIGGEIQMDEYDKLYERIYEVPPGREQIAILEEIVRLADANGDTEIAYGARRQFVHLCCEEGYPEKGIVAFSWCLSQFDKDPELDHPHDLIWQYKVILELIPIFPTVSREQIVRMQEDMATRLAQYGESERTAHYYRSWNFMRMGEYETALHHQETYMAMPRTEMSDCEACERDRQIELLTRMHRDEDALKLAKPVMSGNMHCGEVPEFTNGHIVKSQIRLGKIMEATERQQSGYDQIRDERKYLGSIGDLLLVVIRNRDYDTGLTQVTRHLPWAAESAAGELKFRFLSAVSLFFEALASEKPEPAKFRIPKAFACFTESEEYAPKDLANFFAKETKVLADQFNTRNGNQAYNFMVAEHRELCDLGG